MGIHLASPFLRDSVCFGVCVCVCVRIYTYTPPCGSQFVCVNARPKADSEKKEVNMVDEISADKTWQGGAVAGEKGQTTQERGEMMTKDTGREK